MSKKKRLGSDPLERLKNIEFKEKNSSAYILNTLPTINLKREHEKKAKESSKVSLNAEIGAENEIISKSTEPKKPLREKTPIDRDITHKKAKGKIENDCSGGKFLTFFIAGTEYGFRINHVIEIVGLMDIRSIPNMPNFIKGAINLRGNIILTMDLRLRLGIEPAEYTKESVIIIVKVNEYKMGIIVDKILEVSDIADKDIVASPEFGPDTTTDYISCLGKSEGKVKFFLNIKKLASLDDLGEIPTHYGKR